MVEVHVTRAGVYELCARAQDECTAVHLPGVDTLAAAEALPRLFMEELLSATDGHPGASFPAGADLKAPFGPPVWTPEHPVHVWYDQTNLIHRDYDLPAVVEDHGIRMWYQHGKLHRGGDRPAYIANPDTDFELKIWFDHGVVHRLGGKPAIINGYQHDWYEHGVLTKPSLIIVPGIEPFEVDSGRIVMNS